MDELSLFTGAGGGILGTHGLLGWRCRGYVEWDDYCQRVLAARIRDGILDEAPIFGDIRTFIHQGYARRYRGMVDVISAGFPCQPFSIAGNMGGGSDERNMWPPTFECIRIIRPQHLLLENVPGLRYGQRYIQRVLGDLASIGYDMEWDELSAKDFGANHRRKRIWLSTHTMPHANSQKDSSTLPSGARSRPWTQLGGLGGGKLPATYWEISEADVCGASDDVAYRVDRLEGLANGQLPVMAGAAAGDIVRSGK